MKYIFIKQHDSTDCAAACLAMVCLYYKKKVTISKLRDLMGTDVRGTNLIGLAKCAEDLGFKTQAVKIDKRDLKSKFTLPCIANVKNAQGENHFVVVFKIKKNSVIVGDPGQDLMKINMKQFCHIFQNTLLLLVPDHRFQIKKEKSNSLLKQYIKIFFPQKKLIFCSILASLLLTFLSLAGSLFNKIIMDEILPYKLQQSFIRLLIIFIVVSVAQIVIHFIRQWMMIYLSQKLNIPLMLRYFKHIYDLPITFFATRKTGDIITRFSDATIIMNVLTNITISLVLDISMVIVIGSILYHMNKELFGIIIVITFVNMILVLLFKEPYKKINEESMFQSSKLNSQIIESLRSIETIKVNCAEKMEMEILESNFVKLLKCQFKEGMFSNIQNTFSSAASTLGNMGLMYMGILQIIQNEITLGSMMAFMTLSVSFIGPINKLVSLQMQIQEANISIKRLSEILEYEGEHEQRKSWISKIEYDNDKIISFQNVTFRYGNRTPTLKGLTFEIKKGEKIAIVGESGSGKSTIAKLLMKYYLPEDGKIFYNGINIEEYESKVLRTSISYVPQSIELFSRSILDNIKLSKPVASLQEVKKAAKIAYADKFINRLPLQYFTVLEEAGNGLSGGEKQRIVLARALLKKNELYILDECTSNLDFKTEGLIIDLMNNYLKDKTIITIAHRLSTIKSCDRIYVLDEGMIKEQGRHEELLEKNGIYRKMWKIQQGI